MKNIFIFALYFLAFDTYSFVSLEDRAILEVEGYKLSPFWATEFVGADLVKKRLRQRLDSKSVPFAIFDTGFEKEFVNSVGIEIDSAMNGRRQVIADHGTSVANIINGKGQQSVSEVVDYVQLSRVSPAIFYSSAISKLKKLKTRPMVISNSVGWVDDSILDLAMEVDKMGVIWVLAAGNDYPEAMIDFESSAPVIKVGSYSPFGLQTIYSQESSELTILAPGDEYLASTDGRGNNALFGATSGATPVVSGMIANVKSLLPSLNRVQVEKLIKKTAIRSLNFYYRNIKTGLFNGFKFFIAAVEIKDRCGNDGDCINREVELFEDTRTIFRRDHAQAQNFCDDKENNFTEENLSELREDFLINPSNEVLPLLLSCIYKKIGLSLNAKFYENIYFIYHDPDKMMDAIALQANAAIKAGYKFSSSLRDIELFNSETFKLLEEAFENDNGIGSHQAKEILDRAKKEGLR